MPLPGGCLLLLSLICEEFGDNIGLTQGILGHEVAVVNGCLDNDGCA